MNRAHANAREDNTELERVVEELYEFDFYTDGGNIGGNEVEPWLRRSLKSYAQTVAEEAVREDRSANEKAVKAIEGYNQEKLELTRMMREMGNKDFWLHTEVKNRMKAIDLRIEKALTPLPDKE